MVMGLTYTRMETSMKENGKKLRSKVKVSSTMSQEIGLKDFGRMI